LVKWLSWADLLFLWLNYLPLKIFISASGISEPFNAAAVPYFLLNYKCKVLCLFSTNIFFPSHFSVCFGPETFFVLALSDRALCRAGEMNFTFRPAGSAPRRVAHKKKRMEKGEGLLGKWEWKWESFKCNLRLSTMQQCGRMSR